MKRIKRLVLLVFVSSFLFAMTALAADGGSFTITADKSQLSPGDTVTVTAAVSQNPGITTLAFDVEYDSSVFELETKSIGGLLVNNTDVVDTNGKVGFDLGDDTATADVTVTGELATFVLRVKSDVKNGSTSIRIGSSEAYNKDINNVSFDAPVLGFSIVGGACESHQMEKKEALAATCEADGNIEYYHCSVCGKYFSDADGVNEISKDSVTVAATGHAWNEGVVAKEATCEENGVIIYTCGNCGTTREEIISATGHTWDEGVVTKEATYDEDGSILYTCKVCGMTKEEVIKCLEKVGYAEDGSKRVYSETEYGDQTVSETVADGSATVSAVQYTTGSCDIDVTVSHRTPGLGLSMNIPGTVDIKKADGTTENILVDGLRTIVNPKEATAEEKSKITNSKVGAAKGMKVTSANPYILDITLMYGNVKIDETTGNISIIVTIPEDSGLNFDEPVAVVRIHNGQAELLDTWAVGSEPRTYGFATDKFSTYGFVNVAKGAAVSSPKTGDMGKSVWMAVAAVLILTTVVVFTRRKRA